MNPTDIIGILGAAKTAFDAAKAGVDAVKGLIGPKNNPEIKAKLVELKGHLLDAQDKVLSLREAMQSLKEENLALAEKLSAVEHIKELRAIVKKEIDGYYLIKPLVGYDEGPYCPNCFDTRGVLVHNHMDLKACLDCLKKPRS